MSLDWKVLREETNGLLMSIARQQFNLSVHDAEDVVQDVYISFAKQVSKGLFDKTKGNIISWMTHFAKWRIIDALRRNASRNKYFVEQDEDSIEQQQAESCDVFFEQLFEAEDKDFKRRVLRYALASIKSKKQRIIFKEILRGRLSVQQIAEKYNTTAANVYLAKHRVGAAVTKEIERIFCMEQVD